MQVRNGFFVAVVLGLGSGMLPAQADNKPTKNASEGYQSVWQLWNKGEGKQAEATLQKLVEQFPQDVRLGLFLATCVASHEPDTTAEAYFSRVVELGAKSAKSAPEPLAAQHFLHLSDPDSANEAFAALAELARQNSKDPILIWLYAQAAQRMEKPEVAEKAFNTLLKQSKDAPSVVRQGYADVLEAQGKHFFALEHRLKIASYESSPASLHALCANLTTLSRFSEAASVATLATKSFPGAPHGWHDLGVISAKTNQNDLALTHFSKAAELSSRTFDKSQTLLAWGSCLESQKKFVEAAEKYRRVASLQGVSAQRIKEANQRARAAELASGGN